MDNHSDRLCRDALESTHDGNSAGFDFGLKRYLTGSDYNDYVSPQFFKRSLNAETATTLKVHNVRTQPCTETPALLPIKELTSIGS